MRQGASSSSSARAYLLREGQYLLPLGSPVGGQNRLLARGAQPRREDQPGDILCVVDRGRFQYGCEEITIGDERLALIEDQTWVPVVQLTPVSSQTFEIDVSGLGSGLTLKARLFPEYGAGTTSGVSDGKWGSLYRLD